MRGETLDLPLDISAVILRRWRRYGNRQDHLVALPGMKDPRFTRLAQLLVHHSARVQNGDKVLIEAHDIPPEFTTELIREVAGAGGVPFVSTYQQAVTRALLQNASEEQMRTWARIDRGRMEEMACYIGVRG